MLIDGYLNKWIQSNIQWKSTLDGSYCSLVI